MFCLRNWAALLIILSAQSPIYILFYLTGFYILQKPCVYCSILLFVLVFSLFDFSANWFEPRWNGSLTMSLSETATSLMSGNTTITGAVLETASLAVSALNGTGGSLASMAMEDVKRRISGGSVPVSALSAPNGSNAFEVWRIILEKRGLRIPCLDVVDIWEGLMMTRHTVANEAEPGLDDPEDY